MLLPMLLASVLAVSMLNLHGFKRILILHNKLLVCVRQSSNLESYIVLKCQNVIQEAVLI